MAQSRPRTKSRRTISARSTAPSALPPLAACVEDYIADAIARNLRDSTIAHYRRSLGHLVAYAPSDDAWRTESGVRTAVAALRAGSYRVASIIMILRVWQSFLRFCHAEGLCETDLSTCFRPPRSEPRIETIVTPGQLRALIAAAHQGQNALRDEAIVTLMYDCGLRASEVCTLQVQDVDLNRRAITVRSGKTGRRTVPIGHTVARALRRHLAAYGDSNDPEMPLFASAMTYESLSRFSLRDILDRLGARAGVKIHPHQLRHTFAVTYIRNGGDVFSLQRILGHSTLDMSRWYAELADSDVQARHAVASPADRLRRG
jgi:site-specific recombinase XerD